MGLIGLSLYLAALLTFAGQAGQRLRESHRRRSSLSRQTALIIALLSTLAGQSADALASPSWQFPEVSLLFWAVLGVGLASIKRGTLAPELIPVSPRLRKAGRWALSGGLAVALAAQLLPFGLLTPVEAYSVPAGYTLLSSNITLLSSSNLSSTGTTIAGSILTFKVTAIYQTTTGGTVTYDVTTDSKTVFSGILANGATIASPLTGKFPSGVYTVPAGHYSTGSYLQVYFTYTDINTKKSVGNDALPLTVVISTS